MYIEGILKAIPLNRKLLPRTEYCNFAQTVSGYLKFEQRAIVISSSVLTLARSDKRGFTFSMAFKKYNKTESFEILKDPDALAGKLYRSKIKQIILHSGVEEKTVLDLMDSLRTETLETRVEDFKKLKIDFEFEKLSEEKIVHSFSTISPPPQVEVKARKHKKVPLEPKPAITPAPKKLEEMTPEELLKAGKELNKLVFVKEGVEKSKEKIKAWMSFVETAIEKYKRGIKRNPKLLAKRYIYLDLEKRRQQFARHPKIRMNIKEFEIPSRQISMERRSQKRETKSYSDPFLEWLKEQPFYSLTFEPGLALIYRRFQMRVLHAECQQIISTWERHGRSMLDEKELNELILWLRYLLEGNNLERKYHKENERTLKRFRADFQKFHAEFVRIWHKIAFDE